MADEEVEANGFLDFLRHTLCGLTGHEYMFRVEGTRVFLVCSNCQHATPGWDNNAPAPVKRFDGDPDRHRG